MQQVLKNQSFYFSSTNKIQIQLSVINRGHSGLYGGVVAPRCYVKCLCNVVSSSGCSTTNCGKITAARMKLSKELINDI